MAELLMDDWLDKYFGRDDRGFLNFYFDFISNNEHKHLELNDIQAIFNSKLRDEKIKKILND
jgi:hypothetical protein